MTDEKKAWDEWAKVAKRAKRDHVDVGRELKVEYPVIIYADAELKRLRRVVEAARGWQKNHLTPLYPNYVSTANGFVPATRTCDCGMCAALDALKEG